MDFFDVLADLAHDRPLTKEQMQENEKYLVNHPLFSKEVPQGSTGNQDFEALLALKQDDDPNQVAQDLNKQANKRLAQSPNGLYHMKQAYQKYTEAIKIKCPSPSINAKLHSNRAHLNLKLKNYGKVIEDCKSCLKFDANYTKGYYRYSKALIALQKYDECIQLLSKRDQEQLKPLLLEATEKNKKKLGELELKKQKKEEGENQIRKICEKKGWKYFKREQPLPEGVKLQIINNNISIPILFLYPEFSQSDIISSSFEDQKVKDVLKQVLSNGLPWDSKGEYEFDKVQVFSEISEAVLMKIPKQSKISDILSRVPFKQALQLQVVRKDNQFYKFYTTQSKII